MLFHSAEVCLLFCFTLAVRFFFFFWFFCSIYRFPWIIMMQPMVPTPLQQKAVTMQLCLRQKCKIRWTNSPTSCCINFFWGKIVSIYTTILTMTRPWMITGRGKLTMMLGESILLKIIIFVCL
jgi:hypothetical protein